MFTTNPQSAWQTPNSTNGSSSADLSANKDSNGDEVSPMIDTRSQYSSVRQAIQSSKLPLQSQTESSLSVPQQPQATSRSPLKDSFSHWNSVEVRPRRRVNGEASSATLPIETEEPPRQFQETLPKIPTQLPPPDPQSSPKYSPQRTSEGRKV